MDDLWLCKRTNCKLNKSYCTSITKEHSKWEGFATDSCLMYEEKITKFVPKLYYRVPVKIVATVMVDIPTTGLTMEQANEEALQMVEDSAIDSTMTIEVEEASLTKDKPMVVETTEQQAIVELKHV